MEKSCVCVTLASHLRPHVLLKYLLKYLLRGFPHDGGGRVFDPQQLNSTPLNSTQQHHKTDNNWILGLTRNPTSL
jgi:hypothetical protein